MKLLIASNNPGKIQEIQQIFSQSHLEILTPNQVGIDPKFDPPETGSTFHENALIKAKAFGELTNLPTMADDSGLEVDALDGRPGVYSKRYGNSDEDRNRKLLEELKDTPPDKRTARFISAVCIYNPKTQTHQTVEGRVEGTIATKPLGDQGFGYDPVFIPNELNGLTFAQAGQSQKNQISHRARALEQLAKIIPKFL